MVGLTKLDDTINLTESIQKKHERTTRVWQKWRFSAPQTHLWLIKVWFSASTFVVKIATFAKPENVSGQAKCDTYHYLNEKMELKLNERKLTFKIIQLTFDKKNIENIFYDKNNKTLKETFEHDKYSRLKTLLADKYKNQLDLKLGDFLKHLKQTNDKNYLCFLNKYGDNKFCEFKIQDHLTDKGIYCYIKNGEIKYIGRCTDNFKKRINQGYGKIHPKNCFKDGQATNCHLNSLINSADNIEFGVYLMTDKSTEEIKELEKLILTCNRYEWNIQTS